MKSIAHRGYKTSSIKENTLESFQNARNNEFDGFECDIRSTKDGVIVICHDSSIDRVSDGSGFIRDMSYEELTKYNFGSSNTKSKIPTLKEVLTGFPDMLKIIEIKSKVDLSTIEEYVDDKTIFIGFDTSYIMKLKKEYPKFKFGILNYVLNSIADYDLDVICLLDTIATDEVVMHFLRKGITVFIYGIIGKIDYKRDYKNLYYIVEHKTNL